MYRALGLWIALVSGLLLACSDPSGNGEPDAGELEVRLALADNPESTLSALATVDTNWECRVELEFWSDDVPPQRTWRSPAGRVHQLPVVSVRAETTYTVRAIAFVDGVEAGVSAEHDFTTGMVPPEILPFDVEVLDASRVQPGVTMFVPIEVPFDFFAETLTYVGVDTAGEVVWYYQTDIETPRVNPITRLLPDGTLLIGVYQGFRNITIAGETLWELTAGDAGLDSFHHDAALLPNGNLLVIGGHRDTYDVGILGGLVEVDADSLHEVTPSGEIVWEWFYVDEVGFQRFPGPLAQTANMGGSYEMTHANAVTYVDADAAILLSVRNQSWILKIDHATGEVLWTFGDEGDFVLTNEDASSLQTWFYSQHAPELLADGSLFLYDNGNDRLPLGEERFSRAVQYQLNESTGEAELVWQYRTATYTPILGDADLLPGGNVLVCVGGTGVDGQTPSQIVEVTRDATPVEVWMLSYPSHILYRAEREPSLYVPRD